jgi:hypothetical protein
VGGGDSEALGVVHLGITLRPGSGHVLYSVQGSFSEVGTRDSMRELRLFKVAVEESRSP